MRRLVLIAALLLPQLAAGDASIDSSGYCTSATQVASCQTTSFTATAGHPIVVSIASANQGAAPIVSGITDTLGNTYAAAVTRRLTGFGTAEVWTATSSSSGSVQVTPSLTNSGGSGLVVEAYSVNGSTTLGHTAVDTPAGAPATVTVTPTAAGSLIFAAGFDYNAGTARTFLSNSTNRQVAPDGNTDADWVQYLTSATTGTAPVTVGTSAPSSVSGWWGMAALEILDGGAGAAVPTASPAGGGYSTAQSVTLSCASPSPTIRYTTDGTTPDGSSTVYSGALSAGIGTTTIKAICQSSGLPDSSAMTATYYVYPVQYVGSSALSAGTATVTCAMPTGGAAPAANDILLLAVSSENEAISLGTANGFAQVPTCSPQSAGTAATDPGSRLALFWKRAAGSDSAPIAADSGNNTECAIHVFRGATTTGDPWNVCAGGNDSAANDTSGVVPGATTTVAGTTVALFTSTSYNATVSDDSECSGWTNADLDGLAGYFARTNTAGLGGGHCLAVGYKSTAGAYGTTSVTLAHTSYKGAISIALAPPAGDGTATVAGASATATAAAVTSSGTGGANGTATPAGTSSSASAGAASASGSASASPSGASASATAGMATGSAMPYAFLNTDILATPPNGGNIDGLDRATSEQILRDNAGAGDLFALFYSRGSGSGAWYLVTSSDGGASWTYRLATSGTNPTPSNPWIRDQAIAQDSVSGKIHLALWLDDTDSALYNRAVLARDGSGHITGWSWEASAVTGPSSNLAGTSSSGWHYSKLTLREVIDGNGAHILMLTIQDRPSSTRVNRVLATRTVAGSTALAPAGASDWKKITDATATGYDTIVAENTDTGVDATAMLNITGRGAYCTEHEKDHTFQQLPADRSIHVFSGHWYYVDTTTGVDDIRRWRFTSSGANWVLSANGTIVTSDNTNATTDVGNAVATANYVWFTYGDNSGLHVSRIGTAGTWTTDAVAKPDATANAWWYSAISVAADESRVWAMWERDNGGAEFSGYYNGSSWAVSTDTTSWHNNGWTEADNWLPIVLGDGGVGVMAYGYQDWLGAAQRQHIHIISSGAVSHTSSPAGASVAITAGTVTASAGSAGTATVAGAQVSATASAANSSGAAGATVSASSGTATAVTVTASGGSTATASGASTTATAAATTSSAGGSGTASPASAGVSAAAAAVSSAGGSAATIAAASSTSSAHSVTASAGGSGTAIPTRAGVTASAASVSSTGSAVAAIAVASSTASARSVTASAGSNGTATISAASISSSAGAATSLGGALATVLGASASAVALAAGSSGDALATIVGAAARATAGVSSIGRPAAAPYILTLRLLLPALDLLLPLPVGAVELVLPVLRVRIP